MKFASVLAALTIANANGQKRHHAIRRVQEDQSMSMMLDPNKGTKDTGRSTTTRKTSTSNDEGCDFSDFTGDWAPAGPICELSYKPEVTVPFQRPDFVNGTEIPAIPAEFEFGFSKVCNENQFISLIAEEDGTVQGTYITPDLFDQEFGVTVFDARRNQGLHIASLIGYWNDKNGKCSFSVVDTESSLKIEGYINDDDELHVEATAPGSCKECLAPTEVDFSRDPPTYGLPTGPFPTTFQGTFTKKDEVCMDTDIPENEECRFGPQGSNCLLSCCVESKGGSLNPEAEQECVDEILEPTFVQYKEGCECIDTVNFGCAAETFFFPLRAEDFLNITHTDIDFDSPICGEITDADIDSFKFTSAGGIVSFEIDSSIPSISLGYALNRITGGCQGRASLDDFPPQGQSDLRKDIPIQVSYDLPPGEYAFSIVSLGNNIDCDSPAKYRIELIDEEIEGVDVITIEEEVFFVCPEDADREKEGCVSSPEDDINAGCFLDTPVYEDYTVGNTVCGSSSSYSAESCPAGGDGGAPEGLCSDRDSYKFTVDETGSYEVEVAADKVVFEGPAVFPIIKRGNTSIFGCEEIEDVEPESLDLETFTLVFSFETGVEYVIDVEGFPIGFDCGSGGINYSFKISGPLASSLELPVSSSPSTTSSLKKKNSYMAKLANGGWQW